MRARLLYSGIAVAMLALGGCTGLNVKPMPDRLPEEVQQTYDYGWEHLVSLGSEVERTALLDSVLLTQSWHAGVDSLYLRSEKRVGDTRVVMESRFDRADPAQDSFTVTFRAKDDSVLRQEVFNAADLNDAMAVFMTLEGDVPEETPEARNARQVRLQEKMARLQRVSEVFPAPPEELEELSPIDFPEAQQ